MSDEAKKGGSPSRDILYSEAAKHAIRAIEVLVEIMEKGDSDSARTGAAKTILAKAIPDLKAMELKGEITFPKPLLDALHSNNSSQEAGQTTEKN